jgi:hypothetical protein
MQPRNQVRPRVEELGSRIVPAGGLHLSGHHAFAAALTAQFTPPVTVSGNLAGSLLQGGLSLDGVRLTAPGVNPIEFLGPLTITTPRGSVTTQGFGMIDVQKGTFLESGTITGGTGKFQGATGNFMAQGSFNVVTHVLNGIIAGTISGHGSHQMPHS